MAVRLGHVRYVHPEDAEGPILMVGGDVLILVGLVGSEMAEVKCCNGEDATHEELMVETFFAYCHAPKVMGILLVRCGVTCLGGELVQ